MKAIGYVRASTIRQVTVGASIEAQTDAIERECERRGWQLLALERDAASARSLKRRPGLERAMAELDAGRYETLLVARMDRAFRSVGDFANTLARAEKGCWELRMLDPDVDTTSPYGRAMAHVAAAFAQLESDLISQRTREAIAVRRAAGTFRGGRVAHPTEVPTDVVERIMRHAGARSSREIAEMLTLSGEPAPRGEAWSSRTVRKVIARERDDSPANA